MYEWVVDLRSRAEKENHNQGMWEADFGTIDCAVTRSLDDSKHICISRVEYYLIECFLRLHISICYEAYSKVLAFTYINRVDSSHRDGL